MSIGAIGYSTDFYRAGYRKNSSNDSDSKFTTMGSATQETTRDLFREAVQKFRDDNQLTAQELKEEKDWREMTDEEWDKMLEGVDEYIDAFKERLRQLKEIQDEAAQKAALEADSDMRATAASAAALSAAANGLGGTSEADAESQTEEGVSTKDGVKHEKNWTKNLKTDDQTVLRTAKEAQEMEKKALSRFEEVQLTGTTTVGVSQIDTVTEYASVEEDENKEKIWTITAFGEDGIVSTRCQNGKIIDSWEIKYTNPNDAKKVQDFIGRFEKDANLIFSGSKDFWEEFLSSDMDTDSINPLIGQEEKTVSEDSGLQVWFGDKSLEEWAATDPKYTDKETGFSWYVRDGKHPYMTGEDTTKFKEMCEETGEPWLKKFAEMTGTIQYLDDNTTAFVGTNVTAIKSKDGKELFVDTSSLSYDMIMNMFKNLPKSDNYFDNGYWKENIRKAMFSVG